MTVFISIIFCYKLGAISVYAAVILIILYPYPLNLNASPGISISFESPESNSLTPHSYTTRWHAVVYSLKRKRVQKAEYACLWSQVSLRV